MAWYILLEDGSKILLETSGALLTEQQPAPPTAVQRRSLSSVGTRVGSRQVQSRSNG